MTRVYVVVEGLTEESFVNQVLAPVLWPREVYVYPIIVGAPGHKGGSTNYARVKRDILAQLKQDRAAYCSTDWAKDSPARRCPRACPASRR